MSNAAGFTAGFTARHNAAAEALHRAFSLGERMFSPSDIKERAGQPRSFSPEEAGYRILRRFDLKASDALTARIQRRPQGSDLLRETRQQRA